MMRNALLVTLASCTAGATLPAARFVNEPPVRAVNDRRDVPIKPREHEHLRSLYNLDGQIVRRITRPLELRRRQRALGVNALDEVPDSTWFTNRAGVRDVSAAEIAAAPGGVGSPEAHKPWLVKSTKVGGMSLGFVIEDARGEKFLMKFDAPGQPEAETATQVVMGKLMWAFGLNVTEDYIARVRRVDLVLATDAAIKTPFGTSRLTREELDRRLAHVAVAADGTMRVLVSHWLSGRPLGAHAAEGVREDDPNDRIPHELRRDLRGLYALFAWLDHTDIHGGNMLDMWIADPADDDRHYVKHYWIDYGIGLGYQAQKNADPRYGFEWYLDYGDIVRGFVTLGTLGRSWERRRLQPLRGLGMYETTLYNPGAWRAASSAYLPLDVADRFDKFWASTIIIRFTREQIEAAVAAGQLSDPNAARWLTDALIYRQRATAKHWFERVNPLDRFVVDGDRLCFDDLAIMHAFATASSTQYTLESYSTAGMTLGAATTRAAGSSGVTCGPIATAPNREYTIVRVDTKRPAFGGSTYVHLARDPVTSSSRVIGIWRQ